LTRHRHRAVSIATLGIAVIAVGVGRAEDVSDPRSPPPPSEQLAESIVLPPTVPSLDAAKDPAADGYAVLPGFATFLNPTVGNAPLRAEYRATWFADEPVAGQPTNLGYIEHDVSVSFPIWQSGADEWTATAGFRGEIFHTNAILPTTRQPFPDELWNIRFGTTYRHQFDNGWISGGGVSVGSASDEPFHSIKEMTAGVNAFLRVPQGDHYAWLFSLAYSPTSELPFPIPGVAFVYQPNENFHATIGLPFQLMYRPIEDLTLDFSYMLLRTVHARATYRVAGPVRVYAGFDWMNEGYFLARREDDNDRFFYYDKRLTGGIIAPIGRHVFLNLSGGYVFDRFYFEGQHYSDSQINRVDVGNGPFVSLHCQVRW
jgi:hypothetical protein